MNNVYPVPLDANEHKTSTTLAERMDPAIGEATTVMGAVLTELLRRSLRGGVTQIGEQLHGYALERVDSAIVDRTPVLEQLATEAAHHTARATATEVATEEVKVTAHRLTVRIEEAERQANETTQESARDLAGKIVEAEKRVTEATHAEITQQVQGLVQQARDRAHLLSDRLKTLKHRLNDLVNQLLEEHNERKAGQAAVLQEVHTQAGALAGRLEEADNARREAEDRLRQDLVGAFEEGQARLREEMVRAFEEGQAGLRREIGELREENRALSARVTELEKPRGLRALLRWLMFWRKR
jgi:hypothetical protein